MFEITVTLRGRIIATSEFDQDVVKIGRSPDNDIFIDNAAFSRHHAVLRRFGPVVYTLQDLGTANGTFVNGRKADTWALSKGDRITVGKYTLIFSCDVELPDAPLPNVPGGAGTIVVRNAEETPDAVERRSPVRAELEVAGRVLRIERDVFLVGRAAHCDLRVPGFFVPETVALVARGYGGFSLVNADREGSVTVNGLAVPWQAWLHDGDVLAFRRVVARFRLGARTLEP